MKKFTSIFTLFALILTMGINATAQERTLEIVKNGQVVFSSPAAEIQYMTVVNRLPAPKNVHGAVANGKITITWDKVDGAKSYKIFRSTDGNNFSALGNTSNTTYTDASPNPGTNYYRVQAIGTGDAESAMSATTMPVSVNQQEGSGIYLGLIGFNQQLTNYGIRQLSESTKQGFFDFIDSFNNNNDGTAIYYAVDQAVSVLQSNSYPADLNSVHIVTFTDGIDNYSLDIYDEVEFGRYSSPDEVGNYVKNRLTSEKVSGIGIIGYAVGSRHKDVNSTRFTSTLNRIATSSSLVYELDDMAAVEAKFKEIAKNITEVNKTQNITVSIAGGLANGERIRFTFDLSSSSTSPTNSDLYIEGTFERTSATTRKITNIYCKGLSMKGTEVVGTKNTETGLFEFTLNDVATTSKTLIDSSKTLEWWGNPWQKDTEFNPDANTKTEVISHSAAIILVLDCTKSLSEKFSQMQASAKSFIATLLNQTEINGHGGVDLGLPSGLLWATCNVGAAIPEDYGNYYAWGETTTKSVYDFSTSLTFEKTLYELKSAGIIDSNNNLTKEYDAASKLWGGNWRMPTGSEIDELVNNTDQMWTTQNGVYGCKVTSKINGNSIFLPAAGGRSDDYEYSKGYSGLYWSSTVCTVYGDAIHAYSLYIHYIPESGILKLSPNNERSLGLSVRPVCKP